MSKSKKIATTADWQKIAARMGVRPERDVSGNPVGKPGVQSYEFAQPDPVQAAPDQGYLAQLAANQQAWQSILAQLPGLVGNASAEYGYKVDYTPPSGDVTDGSPGSYSIGGLDPSNPNSRAALLQRSYENQKRGNTNSLASRGQLYSGALQNAQNDAARGYQASDAANQRSFQQALSGYFNQLGTARTGLLQGNATAAGDLANRLALKPAPSTVQYAGVPYAPGTPDQPFASPVGVPTAASVLQSGSLLGTHITDRPPASYYKPKKAKR